MYITVNQQIIKSGHCFPKILRNKIASRSQKLAPADHQKAILFIFNRLIENRVNCLVRIAKRS